MMIIVIVNITGIILRTSHALFYLHHSPMLLGRVLENSIMLNLEVKLLRPI